MLPLTEEWKPSRANLHFLSKFYWANWSQAKSAFPDFTAQ